MTIGRRFVGLQLLVFFICVSAFNTISGDSFGTSTLKTMKLDMLPLLPDPADVTPPFGTHLEVFNLSYLWGLFLRQFPK